ncbi:hypothetical protein GGI21_000123 [Coemansia aciculifera]|uniref:Uncharacterized protein n=1 Tax=Coemansia aciculifera TaxID=417176 RepID=A0ACC1M763_9FUNG|nr:hypothetical protein IWW38_000973 [Coemansia aciculifera]KAJ2911209.1 hypothetical protein GGI21_000123 [Coemansia aciculifera]
MTCSICHEPYFQYCARGSTSSAAADKVQRPAALGCGHTFHKNCVEDWFRSSCMQRCPQCKVVHVGPVTVLFIDIDDEDYEASQNAKGFYSGGCSRHDNADVRQLAWDINTLHFSDEGRDYHVMCELARRNQELEDANMDLEEDLEEAHRTMANETSALDAELDDMAHELERQGRLHRRTEISLLESAESLRREKERTARLENRLETMQALVHRLRDNNFNMRHALAAKGEEIRSYQSRHGFTF